MKPRWADAAFLARQRRTRALDSFWAGIVAGYAEHGTSGVTPIFAYGNADVSGRATPSTGLMVALKSTRDDKNRRRRVTLCLA